MLRRDTGPVDPTTTAGADALRRARALLVGAERVLVLTGAGISTDSGIPDFRGPRGVWTRDPAAERRSSIEHWVSDPELRRSVWRERLDSPFTGALPNAGHRALVSLERSGRLALLVTQNTDGLHLDAGHDPERVVELHGTSRRAMCLACDARWPVGEVLDRVRAGDGDPHCEHCGGLLKSATISFGQSLVAADLRRAEAAARRCDVILAVGSTLSVYPAAGLVPTAKAAGAAVVIANGEPTELDALADVVLQGPIGELLPAIVPGDRPARPRPT